MGRCMLLDDAISTLAGLVPRLEMTFEDSAGVVVAAAGNGCLTSGSEKRSPARAAVAARAAVRVCPVGQG